MPGPDLSAADRAAAIAALRDRIIAQGIRGTPFDQVLEGMSEALVALGIPLMRLYTAFRALHPTHGAFSPSWQSDIGKQSEAFGNDITDQWRASPLYHMLAENIDAFRARADDADQRARFPILQDFHDRGGTDYYARRIAFASPEWVAGYDPDDPPEGMIVSVVAHGAGGFSDRDLADLEQLLPALSLTLKTSADRIEAHGGNVLKFMGDGLLAVFAQDDELRAGTRALACVQQIRAGMDALGTERGAAGLPVTGCTMALHAGNVLYGNFGGTNRLDFTVIGPAVNTAARP